VCVCVRVCVLNFSLLYRVDAAFALTIRLHLRPIVDDSSSSNSNDLLPLHTLISLLETVKKIETKQECIPCCHCCLLLLSALILEPILCPPSFSYPTFVLFFSSGCTASWALVCCRLLPLTTQSSLDVHRRTFVIDQQSARKMGVPPPPSSLLCSENLKINSLRRREWVSERERTGFTNDL